MSFTTETIDARPVLGIRFHATIAEIGDRIGEAAGELAGFVRDRAAGPLVSRYHTWDGQGGDMEVALPLREPVAGEGRMVADELPGGRAAVAVHVGPYDGLKGTWESLKAWMEEQGLEGRAAPWEEYVSDPRTTPPEKLETRIVWPVA